MQFKKYPITEKSKKVDTQLVSFICHGVWTKGSVAYTQTQNYSICIALRSDIFFTLSSWRGISLWKRFPSMKAATVYQAMSR